MTNRNLNSREEDLICVDSGEKCIQIKSECVEFPTSLELKTCLADFGDRLKLSAGCAEVSETDAELPVTNRQDVVTGADISPTAKSNEIINSFKTWLNSPDSKYPKMSNTFFLVMYSISALLNFLGVAKVREIYYLSYYDNEYREDGKCTDVFDIEFFTEDGVDDLESFVTNFNFILNQYLRFVVLNLDYISASIEPENYHILDLDYKLTTECSLERFENFKTLLLEDVYPEFMNRALEFVRNPSEERYLHELELIKANLPEELVAEFERRIVLREAEFLEPDYVLNEYFESSGETVFSEFLEYYSSNFYTSSTALDELRSIFDKELKMSVPDNSYEIYSFYVSVQKIVYRTNPNEVSLDQVQIEAFILNNLDKILCKSTLVKQLFLILRKLLLDGEANPRGLEFATNIINQMKFNSNSFVRYELNYYLDFVQILLRNDFSEKGFELLYELNLYYPDDERVIYLIENNYPNNAPRNLHVEPSLGYFTNSSLSDIADLNEYADYLVIHESFEEAVEVLKRVLLLDQNNIEALNLISTTLFRLSRLEEAENYVSNLISLEPDNRANLTRLGLILNEQHRYEEAEVYIRLAMESMPSDINTLDALSTSLVGQERYLEAEEVLNQILTNAPNHIFATYKLIIVKIQKGDYENAIEIGNQLSGLVRGNSRILNLYILALLKSKDYFEAELMSREVLQNDSRNTLALKNLIVALLRQEKFEAIELYSRMLLAIQPDSIIAQQALNSLTNQESNADISIGEIDFDLSSFQLNLEP